MENMKEVHILNHTHWDREWYETFDEFRYKLRNGLRFVRDLIENGKINHFFLDGQTIVLDDYQEIVSPQEFERFVSLIKDGKIEVGPWYLLADEFLVSGESIIKNLEIGTKMAKELGSPANIGYLPDTFGHISQMPQLLKGFNIPAALIFRGAVSETFENVWQGADESKIFTFVLPLFEGYYQTFLKHNDYKAETKDYLERLSPYLKEGKALIMNGADHTFTCADLTDRVEQLSSSFPQVQFKQTNMSDFIKAFEGTEPSSVITGEQRDPSKIFILPGVLSTRTYLKDQNQLCEDQAIGVMEALNVWTNGETDSDAFIEHVWKLILQNQPHDSICGCSVDEVHDEMEIRSQKVLNSIRQFSKDTLNAEFPFEFLNSKVENSYLYLVNNTPLADVYPVTATIRIPAEQDLGAIRLSYDGKPVPFDLLKREKREEFLRHILAEPHYADYLVYEVQLMMAFDGAEIKRVLIEKIAGEAGAVEPSAQRKIENEYYQIGWDDNSLIITDLESGLTYENQHLFLSSLDAGDTYNYSPPIDDIESKALISSISNIETGLTYQSVKINYEMRLPAYLNEGRTGPSGEYVINKMTTTVTLFKGRRMVNFKTTIHNAAKDQKLRVGFRLGDDCPVSYSDTAFDLVKRQTIRDKEWDMPKNKEAVMNQYPTSSAVFAGEHQIVQRGLQEYEVDRYGSDDYVFLTLIRGVGWLSRRDLRTRGNGAGPGFETPGAQCLGTYSFEYGLVLRAEHHSLNQPKMLRQHILTQQSYQLKNEQKLFKQSSSAIVFSSFIQKEKDSFDIRLFNPSLEEAATELSFGFEPGEVAEVNFNGEERARYTAARKVRLVFKPKEIKTIRVWRKSERFSIKNEGVGL